MGSPEKRASGLLKSEPATGAAGGPQGGASPEFATKKLRSTGKLGTMLEEDEARLQGPAGAPAPVQVPQKSPPSSQVQLKPGLRKITPAGIQRERPANADDPQPGAASRAPVFGLVKLRSTTRPMTPPQAIEGEAQLSATSRGATENKLPTPMPTYMRTGFSAQTALTSPRTSVGTLAGPAAGTSGSSRSSSVADVRDDQKKEQQQQPRRKDTLAVLMHEYQNLQQLGASDSDWEALQENAAHLSDTGGDTGPGEQSDRETTCERLVRPSALPTVSAVAATPRGDLSAPMSLPFGMDAQSAAATSSAAADRSPSRQRPQGRTRLNLDSIMQSNTPEAIAKQCSQSQTGPFQTGDGTVVAPAASGGAMEGASGTGSVRSRGPSAPTARRRIRASPGLAGSLRSKSIPNEAIGSDDPLDGPAVD